MNLDTLIFLASAVIAVFGATMMISQRNPVASVLYLILSLLAQAVLYVQLGALFMAAVLIIVYAGAVLVLFLFVIMLLNLRGREDLGRPSPPFNRITKYTLSILFVAQLVMVVRSSISSSLFVNIKDVSVMSMLPAGFGSVEEVATVLFQKYLYPFELVSVLILAAVVGAVLMAKKERDGEGPPGADARGSVENLTDRVTR
ncbi:MAG: NADH-quinone oxidoreductase subunit J [candidate division Zixibacteria bacterium]|nr:NADH-quinone oxidoreductase subunit J [candidate division Zixibacteria bacterium]